MRNAQLPSRSPHKRGSGAKARGTTAASALGCARRLHPSQRGRRPDRPRQLLFGECVAVNGRHCALPASVRSSARGAGGPRPRRARRACRIPPRRRWRLRRSLRCPTEPINRQGIYVTIVARERFQLRGPRLPGRTCGARLQRSRPPFHDRRAYRLCSDDSRLSNLNRHDLAGCPYSATRRPERISCCCSRQ